MSVKASLNGPNRRKKKNNNIDISENDGNDSISFYIRGIDDLFNDDDDSANNLSKSAWKDMENSCFFNPNGRAGKALLQRHLQITEQSDLQRNKQDPILIHFHDIPVFVIRATPFPESYFNSDDNDDEGTNNINLNTENYDTLDRHKDCLFLTKLQGHINKVCVDTIMQIRCCSRPNYFSAEENNRDYDSLSHVQVEVYLPKKELAHNNTLHIDNQKASNSPQTPNYPIKVNAKDISRKLLNCSYRSVLTDNELLVITLDDGITDIACRIASVRTKDNDKIDNDSAVMDFEFSSSNMTSTEASMEDPYRGRVVMDTEFCITTSSACNDVLQISGSKILPEGKLPEDVIHVTTSDKEWFPVRRILLAPCIKLTKYVQAGRGKYTNIPIPTLSDSERSPDAPSPTDDNCPHCLIPIDCCTFDRVLLFIMSLLYPNDPRHKFQLENSEVNTMAEAADILGLLPLSDLCASKHSSFDSRVRKHEYIRFAEVQERNKHGELLILLDGMVLDITRWLEEHPGGSEIIPKQALNIDSTVFFEMYHVSKQSFYYLKSFYIGELAPEDISKLKSSAEGVSVSDGFLQSLKSFTSEWRVKIDSKVNEKVHKSL